jgi:hypothetical protein
MRNAPLTSNSVMKTADCNEIHRQTAVWASLTNASMCTACFGSTMLRDPRPNGAKTLPHR